jgi:hypothetical protein
MFTIHDIRQRYGVTIQTVLGWIRSGELRAVNVSRHPESRKPRWRISEEALAEFERDRTPPQCREELPCT